MTQTAHRIELSPRSFVGRKAELEHIERAFDAGAHVVTVTGSSGTGKTRVAREFAARRATLGPVWFCDLSQVESSTELCAALAAAIGLRVGPSDPADAVETIGGALARRSPALLVLDNFEQLVEEGGPLVAQLADEAPEVELLITSQQRLRLPEEHCVALAPLPLPPEDERQAEEIARFDAVRLFLDRAGRGSLSAQEALQVAAIVRELDGLPLAIELAAARVNELGLDGLRSALGQRLDVLAEPGAVERHRTLRSAIDWSWAMLSSEAQRALSRSSVFRGGFTLAAFAEVTREGDDPDELSALRVLQTLHDKSFVVASPTPGIVGESRFGLFESIRVYAREKLEQLSLREQTEERHAEHYIDAASVWLAELDGPLGAQMRRRLELERENLLAVYDRALRDGNVPAAVSAIVSLEVEFSTHGPIARFVDLLDSALVLAPEGSLAPRTIAQAELARGRVRVVQGRFGDGINDFERALTYAERSDDRELTVLSALKAGQALAMEGRSKQAEVRFERARAVLQTLDSPRLERQFFADVSLVRAQQGRTREALELSEKALALARRLGNRREEGATLGNIGARLNELGRISEARTRYQEALEILNEVGDRRAAAVFEAHLANMDEEAGDLSGAEQRLERALTVHHEIGDVAWEGIVYGLLGNVRLRRRRFREAASAYREAAARLPGNYRRWAGLFAAAQATAEAEVGELEAAKTHLAVARQTLEAVGAPSDLVTWEVHERLVTLARARRNPDPEASIQAHTAAESLMGELDRQARREPLTDEVRFPLRLLASALSLGDSRVPSSPFRETLKVGPDAEWFATSDGERVDLSRRNAPRRLLAKLVDAQQNRPGAGVSLEGLFDAAWPGVAIRPDSQAARVYVAIGTLRKLGLATMLLRQDDGYLLDPAIPVVLAS
ncbi:MAG: tetratricopeptide repeat protein [Myxococcales bacterium]|nr:tetratricopeptide repeat protein [Myxococcales bacterium]